MTFALMALMLGFAYNVNAQNKGKAVTTKATEEATVQSKSKTATAAKPATRTTAPDAKASAPTAQKKQPKTIETKAGEMDKLLKDYEETVDACVNLYAEMKKYEKSASVNPDKFNQSLKKAESLKAKIENSKDQLNRTQADRFKKATDKLSKVYIK